jgi:hypothetical protein
MSTYCAQLEAVLPSPDACGVAAAERYEAVRQARVHVGAFERISDLAVHRKAVALTTATSGAHGFTNRLDRAGRSILMTLLAAYLRLLLMYRLPSWLHAAALGALDREPEPPADGVLRATDPQQISCLDKWTLCRWQ